MFKSLTFGFLSALFFSFTFILNSEIGNSGGHWLWSASLRFIFMFLILGLYFIINGTIKDIIRIIRQDLLPWLLWSTVGFGVFYCFLTYGSLLNESWKVASTWQITIIAGALLTPFTIETSMNKSNKNMEGKSNRIPLFPILFSSLIIVGVVILSTPDDKLSFSSLDFIGILPIIIAAFAYPLGNRKTMVLAKTTFTPLQRVFGMTLCSMPLWLLLSLIGIFKDIYPSANQISQSLVVAVFSGIIATTLLFKACQAEKNNPTKLAIVESTQSFEVVFTLIIGVFLFGHNMPSLREIIGVIIIIIGMGLNSLIPLKIKIK